MRIIQILLLCVALPGFTNAQMNFKSIGTQQPIFLTIGWHGTKTGFVWYKGQKEPIALQFKSLDIDSSERASGQPDFYTYKWTEMYKGKATGEYGFTEWPRNVADIYYLRFRDGKKFTFELIEEKEYKGNSMALVHNAQFHYYSFYKDSLTIKYQDGTQQQYLLNRLEEESGRSRSFYIDDYNFDGADDVAFSITDGEGLHVVYDVFIYNPEKKTFSRLQLPGKEEGCGYFTNLKRDEDRKELITQCKSGPSWLSYTYKFDRSGKLVPVKNND
jgi:hypothetical protein